MAADAQLWQLWQKFPHLIYPDFWAWTCIVPCDTELNPNSSTIQELSTLNDGLYQAHQWQMCLKEGFTSSGLMNLLVFYFLSINTPPYGLLHAGTNVESPFVDNLN